jgi:hypothetical protein
MSFQLARYRVRFRFVRAGRVEEAIIESYSRSEARREFMRRIESHLAHTGEVISVLEVSSPINREQEHVTRSQSRFERESEVALAD